MFYLAHRKKKITQETPQSVFEKLRGDYAVLLESGGGNGENVGRYSIIGYEPFLMLVSKNHSHEVTTFHYLADETVMDVQILESDTLTFFQSLLDQMKLKKVEKDLPPFVGGGMGFFSYEFGLKLHGILPATLDDVDAPDVHYCFYDRVVVFDHLTKTMYFFGISESSEKAQKIAAEVEVSSQEGLYRLDEDARLSKYTVRNASGRSGERVSLARNFQVFLDKATYSQKIQEIKKYLKSGDSYQVNFSYRFSFETSEDPWEIYKRLTALNPSPQALFFDFGETVLISCSPERLVSVQTPEMIVQTRPIKGTRPRGKDAKTDKAYEKELLASKKDEAELSMIVDLMRNDLGKVCDAKSIKVAKHREIERYSHVMHTVSTVEGVLKKGKSLMDVVSAMFPGGSVTGCPKQRTMEIIHDLEGIHRDVYCGSAGYISMSGSMDLNILIRTLLYKEGTVYFHSGGGIVMDSVAEDEFDETLHKAQALIDAL
jgi:para-aminobenzoate synthetase component 1